jgi:hypothetical protein
VIGLPYIKLKKSEIDLLKRSGYRERDVLNRKAFVTIDRDSVVTVHAKKDKNSFHRDSVAFHRPTKRIVG